MSRKSEQVLVREDHALPKTVVGISTLVREILKAPGAVERLIVEQGQPIRAWRWSDPDPMEEASPDLDGALRHSEMLEYTNDNDDKTPAEVVLHMMHLLSSESAHPVCWVIGPNTEDLEKWLEFDELGLGKIQDLMAVPIQHLESLPPETLLLAGSSMIEGDVRDITVTVKAVMEPRRENDAQVVHGDADRSRTDPVWNGPAVGALEDHPKPNGAESWSPSRFLRERLDGGRKVR